MWAGALDAFFLFSQRLLWTSNVMETLLAENFWMRRYWIDTSNLCIPLWVIRKSSRRIHKPGLSISCVGYKRRIQEEQAWRSIRKTFQQVKTRCTVLKGRNSHFPRCSLKWISRDSVCSWWHRLKNTLLLEQIGTLGCSWRLNSVLETLVSLRTQTSGFLIV